MTPSTPSPGPGPRAAELFRQLRGISLGGKTGVLEFRRGEARASVGFLQGEMVFPSGPSLSAYLVRERQLTREQVQSARRQQRPGEDFTLTLGRAGCLPDGAATAAAHAYLDQLLRAVALWPDGTLEFREAVPEDGIDSSRRTCPVLARILSVVRSMEDPVTLFPEFRGTGTLLSLAEGAADRLTELVMQPEEGYLLSRITGTHTLDEVLSLSPLDRDRTLKILCSLRAAGILETRNGGRSATAPAAASPGSGGSGWKSRRKAGRRPTRKTGLRKKRHYVRRPSTAASRPVAAPAPTIQEGGPEELNRRFDEIGHQDYYQMLGVNPFAGQEGIRKSYYELARHFHPDRFHRSGDNDLAEKAEKLLSHLTEAYSVLSDTQARMKYDQERADASRPRQQDAHADQNRIARENHQRGLQLLQAGQLQRAMQFLENAVRMSPSNDQYLCDLAQVQMRNPKLRPQARDNLSRAIALNPARSDNYLQLGLLLQREGNLEGAIRCLEQALTWDPENQRIQRLLNEARAGTKKGGFSGLFGK